ncbi:MAG: metal ABC transporter permease [Candidatus Aureabacteria bacterium]|nr:metal ABC transporter permease [Candidatus Auribacterota bacterium]
MSYFIEMLGMPFLACVLMTFILGYIGIHVLKREIIFIDITLAQVAALGAITAHIFFHVHGDSILSYLFSISFTLTVAFFFALVRKKIIQIPLEAVIGIFYALAAAAALFLIGVTTGAHSHVTEMLSGSILWVGKKDILWCLMIFSTVGFFFYLFRKSFDKISENYEHLQELGINVVMWDFIFYTLVGIVITQSVKIGGVVLVFGFLIIPAALSALYSKNQFYRLLITWITGIFSSFLGLLFAERLDFSVGPSVCLLLGIVLIIGSILYKIFLNKSEYKMS